MPIANKIESATNQDPKRVDSAPLRKYMSGSGLYLVMVAMSENIPALLNYNAKGLMGLGVALGKIQSEYSKEWVEIMSSADPNSDLSKIQKEMASSDEPDLKSAKLTKLTAEYRQHNLMYDQMNSFYTNLSNGVNQNSSEVTQSVKENLEIMGKGPLAQAKALTEYLA